MLKKIVLIQKNARLQTIFGVPNTLYLKEGGQYNVVELSEPFVNIILSAALTVSFRKNLSSFKVKGLPISNVKILLTKLNSSSKVHILG